MNRQIILFFLFGIFIVTILNSCQCSCYCDKNLGCKILTVKLNTNNSVVKTKMFCSQTNFETDNILKDSVDNFKIHYNTDSTTVTEIDSIYKYERVEQVKCKKQRDYKDKGYGCECFK